MSIETQTATVSIAGVGFPLPQVDTDSRPAYRVLVVEDDPMIRSLLLAVLKRAGYETDSAKDGFSALEKSTEAHFDMILTDLRMPGMWGTEFYQKLRESRPDLAERVVFATSESIGKDLQEFFETLEDPTCESPLAMTRCDD